MGGLSNLIIMPKSGFDGCAMQNFNVGASHQKTLCQMSIVHITRLVSPDDVVMRPHLKELCRKSRRWYTYTTGCSD